MRLTRTMAAAGAAALLLTGCSGDGGGGEGAAADLPADASPEEVVAAGLGDRLENGAAFTLTMEGDLEALAAEAGEPIPPEAEALFAEGFVSGAFAPETGFALTLGEGDGFLQLRGVEEALYVRVDLQALGEVSPDAMADLPDPQALQGQLGALGLPPEVQEVASAALAGEWVGITGLSQESLESFAESMGGQMPSEGDVEAQQEQLQALLEEKGLTDGDAFTERYLTVEGEGPTYDLTLMARAFVQTLNEIAADLEGQLGATGADMDELPTADDVPETVEGLSVTVEDGTATSLSADLATLAQSAGEDAGDLAEGDVTVRMDMADLGDELAVPEGATTIGFEQLVQSVMGSMFMGGMGGSLDG